MNEQEKAWMRDIPIGKENAISRADLARRWGLGDRDTRQRVSDLRRLDDGSGFVIISASHGCGGYYQTDNIDEIIRFVAENKSRIRHIQSATSKAERILMESRAEGH